MTRPTNRSAILGSLFAALGFFFLPLFNIYPTNLSIAGHTFYLFEIQGGNAELGLQSDFRYILLFALTLVPLVIATSHSPNQNGRGWQLIILGYVLIIFTLWLPAVAADDLLTVFEDATTRDRFFQLTEGQARFANPRVVPGGAIATGIFGGYIILFAGIKEIREHGQKTLFVWLSAVIGVITIYFMFSNGVFDSYSIVAEYHMRGELLEERFIQHVLLVIIALGAGLIVGLGQGVVAARNEQVAPIILYTVSIIQTIPSLALFGLLLVPLADFGRTKVVDVFPLFIGSAVITLILFIAISRTPLKRLDSRLRRVFNMIAALIFAIPLMLFVIISINFIYRVCFIALTDSDFAGQGRLLLQIILLGMIAWIVYPRLSRTPMIPRVIVYGRWGIVLIGVIVLGQMAWKAASKQLEGVDNLNTLTINQLGTSGIGIAPALIALTLYSLLPLVRNTYAGLKNVDPSIIDSGRGMGMTPMQIFLMIELPLAVPIIMAGVRSAAVALVGLATIAAAIGGGGLGQFILQGIQNVSLDQILLGTIPAILLAALLDGGLRALEIVLTSPGIRRV